MIHTLGEQPGSVWVVHLGDWDTCLNARFSWASYLTSVGFLFSGREQGNDTDLAWVLR